MPSSTKGGPAGARVARVTFIRHQAMIAKEIAEGWSALAVYERHQDDLKTISYRQFLRYVTAMRASLSPAKPARSRPARQPTATRPTVSPPPLATVQPAPDDPETDDDFLLTAGDGTILHPRKPKDGT